MAAKGLPSDQRSGNGAINIKISHVEGFASLVNVGGASRVYPAGQREIRLHGNVQGFRER
jgi:hypothetical protein